MGGTIQAFELPLNPVCLVLALGLVMLGGTGHIQMLALYHPSQGGLNSQHVFETLRVEEVGLNGKIPYHHGHQPEIRHQPDILWVPSKKPCTRRSPATFRNVCVHRGPKDHINIGILHSASRAQDKRDSRNHWFG